MAKATHHSPQTPTPQVDLVTRITNRATIHQRAINTISQATHNKVATSTTNPEPVHNLNNSPTTDSHPTTSSSITLPWARHSQRLASTPELKPSSATYSAG